MTDLLLTDEMDLKVTSGDFTPGPATAQHQKLLLIAHPGNFMQYPEIGVGIESHLNDEKDDLRVEIRSQFEKDGMKVKSMQVNGAKIEIEAEYL